MSIRKNEIESIEKVNNNLSLYEWNVLKTDVSPPNFLFEVLIVPEGAENLGELFYSEIKDKLYVVVGSYSSRFYFDEDRYSMETKYFISFLLSDNYDTKCLFTVNDREYWKYKSKSSVVNENLIEQMYKNIFRNIYEVDDILNNFLQD